MKIGILTYYRSNNYGAMLQAVALRDVLHEMGNDVFFVDYWPQHQKNIYRLFVWEDFWRGGIRGRYLYLRKFLKLLFPNLQRRRNFNIFYSDRIRPYVSSIKANYDIIVYGSDQIWRKQGWDYGYNPVYFGKNDFKTLRHVSYAASMGSLPNNEDDIKVVREYVGHIHSISVREGELKTFLNEQGFNNVTQTLDPTLLLSKEYWTSYVNKKRIITDRYLLFYDLQVGAFDYKQVKKFADEHNLKLVMLRGYVGYKTSQFSRNTDGPYDFLNLVYYADYVITSSFHGLAFSIIFQKPFLISLLSNSSRVESLLKSLNLSERLLPVSHTLCDIKVDDINWPVISEIMGEQKNLSLAFLNKSIVTKV